MNTTTSLILIKSNNHYVITLALLNVYYYLIPFSTLMIMLLNLKKKKLIYLDALGQFSKSNELRLVLLYSMLNLAGTPPTPLFLIKASNMYFSSNTEYTLNTILILLLSLISIIFYTQLIKFLYRTTSSISLNVISYFPYTAKENTLYVSLTSIISLLLLSSSYDSMCILNLTNPI